jgi:hypothetical protein
MAFSKYLVSHDVPYGSEGTVTYTNAYVIANHYDHSLAAFQVLAQEIQRDFPHIKDNAVECLSVLKSTWCKGVSVVRALVATTKDGSRPVKDGWDNVTNLDIITS